MSINHTFPRPLLMLAATLVAAPLTAEPAVTVTGQPQPVLHERVSFGDLDLRGTWAQKELRQRVRDAAQRLCIATEGPFTDLDHGDPRYPDYGKTCAQLTYDAVQPRIAAVIRSARSGQPQLAMTLVIAAPAAVR